MQSQLRGRLGAAIVIVAFLLGLTGCGSDGDGGGSTTPTPPAPSFKVLVLGDGGTEDRVVEILTEAGHEVTMGGFWADDPGAGLHVYDVVVMLTGYDYSHFMSEVAQVRITEYVAGGGGLVITEWFAYYGYRNAILAGILPVLESDDYDYGTDLQRPVAGHPISAWLPGSFPTGREWSWVTLRPDTAATAKQATVAVIGETGGPSVVTGVHGDGRVVSWGMAGVYDGDDIWTRGAELLLEGVVRWAGN